MQQFFEKQTFSTKRNQTVIFIFTSLPNRSKKFREHLKSSNGSTVRANSSKEADSSSAAGENKQVNEFSMQQQLPDVAVRRIFSNLDFKDIKTCRLVCQQWHRHALDNTNFLLFVMDLGPARNQQRYFSPKEASSRDRFNYKLIPHVAKADKQPLDDICEGMDDLPEDASNSKKLLYHELDARINSFKPRITEILLGFAGRNERMHPVLQTFIANFPAAKLIFGGCEELDIGYTFEEDKGAAGLDDRAAAMKLRELVLGSSNASDVTATATIIAPSIQQAEAVRICDVPQFQSLLDELERNSDDAPTNFEACKCLELWFNWCRDGPEQFDRVSCFPNIAKLTINGAIDKTSFGNEDFISSVALGNLKHLAIKGQFDELQLPSLRLPSLVHLELERTNLPVDPLQFDSTGLRELKLTGGENLRRLANHARNDGCKNLKTLELNQIEPDDVTAYLPTILRMAKGLQALSIKGEGFEIITETCIRVAAASSLHLAEVECDGNHVVPDEVGAVQCLRELVAWLQATGLKTPLVLRCSTRDGSQLANGLLEMLQSKEIDVDGTPVTVAVLKSSSTEINFDMVWWNNSSGNLQKLRLRIDIQRHHDDDSDIDEDDD